MPSARCPRCGSDKIVPDVAFHDHHGDTGYRSRPATLEVPGNPQAWVFKDVATGDLKADVCGDCGHVEWHATNFRELYQKYLESQG